MGVAAQGIPAHLYPVSKLLWPRIYQMNNAVDEFELSGLSNEYKWRWRCHSDDVWISVKGKSYSGHTISLFQLLLLLNIKSASYVGPDIKLNLVI